MDIELKVAIFKSGKCQWEIARAVGISESKLSQHLRGHGTLTDAEKHRLDEVLGVATERTDIAVGEAE
jgi:hypothetical protein